MTQVEGEPLVHLLTAQSAQEYTSGCGLGWKSRTMPPDLSAWSGALSCPLCTTRLFVLHRMVTSWEELVKLIDLDDPAVAQVWHFSGMRHRFRWLIGGSLIYVYDWPHSTSASQAFAIETGTPKTYENAQARAKQWVQKQIDLFGKTFVLDSYKPGTTLVNRATAPVQKAIPTGPHCHKCLKVDEGDLLPSSEDMTQLMCMPCLVKASR